MSINGNKYIGSYNYERKLNSEFSTARTNSFVGVGNEGGSSSTVAAPAKTTPVDSTVPKFNYDELQEIFLKKGLNALTDKLRELKKAGVIDAIKVKTLDTGKVVVSCEYNDIEYEFYGCPSEKIDEGTDSTDNPSGYKTDVAADATVSEPEVQPEPEPIVVEYEEAAGIINDVIKNLIINDASLMRKLTEGGLVDKKFDEKFSKEINAMVENLENYFEKLVDKNPEFAAAVEALGNGDLKEGLNILNRLFEDAVLASYNEDSKNGMLIQSKDLLKNSLKNLQSFLNLVTKNKDMMEYFTGDALNAVHEFADKNDNSNKRYTLDLILDKQYVSESKSYQKQFIKALKAAYPNIKPEVIESFLDEAINNLISNIIAWGSQNRQGEFAGLDDRRIVEMIVYSDNKYRNIDFADALLREFESVLYKNIDLNFNTNSIFNTGEPEAESEFDINIPDLGETVMNAMDYLRTHKEDTVNTVNLSASDVENFLDMLISNPEEFAYGSIPYTNTTNKELEYDMDEFFNNLFMFIRDNNPSIDDDTFKEMVIEAQKQALKSYKTNSKDFELPLIDYVDQVLYRFEKIAQENDEEVTNLPGLWNILGGIVLDKEEGVVVSSKPGSLNFNELDKIEDALDEFNLNDFISSVQYSDYVSIADVFKENILVRLTGLESDAIKKLGNGKYNTGKALLEKVIDYVLPEYLDLYEPAPLNTYIEKIKNVLKNIQKNPLILKVLDESNNSTDFSLFANIDYTDEVISINDRSADSKLELAVDQLKINLKQKYWYLPERIIDEIFSKIDIRNRANNTTIGALLNEYLKTVESMFAERIYTQGL